MSKRVIKNRKILLLSIILSLFSSVLGAEPKSVSTKGKLDKKEIENIQDVVSPITLQFLVASKDKNNKLTHKQGQNGGAYGQSENLLFRFIIKNDGYVYLVSINNNGVYLIYPFNVPINSVQGTHELTKNDKPQYFSLKKIRGDQFFIALFSKKKLEPEKEIVGLFNEIKWLKDGNLDTLNLKEKSPGIELDYLRIFVKESIPGRPS
jgi:hypothetical protein